MLEVVPVINCHDRDTHCAAEKLRVAEGFAEWVHVDIADARFTFNKTWGDPEEWTKLQPEVRLEVHLMVEDPERVAVPWLEAGAKRLIVHVETTDEKRMAEVVAAAQKRGAEVMLAINPDTDVSLLLPYLKSITAFLVLAVHQPGLAGQPFLPAVLEKTRFLRQKVPKARIEVDGGINPETARLAREAGADVVASATYLFESSSSVGAYETLKNV